MCFLNKYRLGELVAMATSGGIDSAMVLSVLSQTQTWFNTVGMGGIVLIKCAVLN